MSKFVAFTLADCDYGGKPGQTAFINVDRILWFCSEDDPDGGTHIYCTDETSFTVVEDPTTVLEKVRA